MAIIEDNILTVQQTAKLIGVHHSQVHRYIRRGDLAAQMVAGRLLVRRIDAKRFKRPKMGRPLIETTSGKS